MQPMTVHAATACLPGLGIERAVEMIHEGLTEPLLGPLSSAAIQLCPQNLGTITELLCERLVERYPSTAFSLHANSRVLLGHVRHDAGDFGPETLAYFKALADRSRRLNAPGYSLHAGFRSRCTLERMIDNIKAIQDLFGDIPVAVEGLYQNRVNPQLMDTWSAYEQVYRAGCNVALDLSHLNIVARSERSEDRGLLREMLSSAQTIEVHYSANDGQRDRHDLLETEPFWWSERGSINPGAVIFSEGDQMRHARRVMSANPAAGFAA